MRLRIGVLGRKMGLSLVGGYHGPWPEADAPCHADGGRQARALGAEERLLDRLVDALDVGAELAVTLGLGPAREGADGRGADGEAGQRLVEDEAARGRFQTEARAAVKLRHPNAVSVTDFGQTSEGIIYIVMELLEGRTLREILDREAPLETARAISIMLQASDAVAAAHEAGIIHRDLKPANILVTQSADQPAVVKVLDFGIATFSADDDDDAVALAQTNSVIGTPRYMSPEQHNGNSQMLIDNFTAGRYIGLPLLQWFGMTVEPRLAAERGLQPFPQMLRWVR